MPLIAFSMLKYLNLLFLCYALDELLSFPYFQAIE